MADVVQMAPFADEERSFGTGAVAACGVERGMEREDLALTVDLFQRSRVTYCNVDFAQVFANRIVECRQEKENGVFFAERDFTYGFPGLAVDGLDRLFESSQHALPAQAERVAVIA